MVIGETVKEIILNGIKDYKAYDYVTSLSIINKRCINNFENKDKLLLVVAGPNGSGKTTLIANMYKSGNLHLPYINADLFTLTKFKNIKDEKERNIKSMYYTMNQVEKFIDCGKSFCYETVMSHPSKLELFKNAKDMGFKIYSVFVCTNNPEINVSRVNARALQGGHNVDKEKIISRYYRSVELSKELESISDVFLKFDNSLNLMITNKENQK